MKNLFMLMVTLALTTPINAVLADNLMLETFPDQMLPDILDRGLTKERLFNQLERKDVKVGNSQCFNRAHVWAMDMKMKNQIDSGKLFVFYTGKTGHMGRKDWWYHVAPLINEGGKEYVIDGGFPGEINGPLSIEAWVYNFISTTNCKVIQPQDREVFEWMFASHQFPEVYQGKRYDCYIAKTPAAYWSPLTLASAALNRDETGRAGDYRMNAIVREEAYSACLEATTNKLGGVFGAGRAKCKRFK